MKNIKGPSTNEVYYKMYDINGNLKGKIEKSKEKDIQNNMWLRGVSCFVINENNQVLIEKRTNKGLTPGKLDLCSGHIDDDEVPTQAIIRELREELGIPLEESINVVKLTERPEALIFESSGKNKNFLIDFYCLKRNKSNVTIQKQEVADIAWIDLEKAFKLIETGNTKFPSGENYKKIFEKVRELIDSREIAEEDGARD